MKVSIIIPTLNEESCLAGTLASLREQRPHEILVADGGSSDRTATIAQTMADRLLTGARGRAAQMNLGASRASGDALLFLHADCTLELGAVAAVGGVLRRKRVAAGCFTMTVQAPGLLFRWIDCFATARVGLARLIYGDQGLFVRRDLFVRLGGFPAVPFMEDVLFSRRLRRNGRLVVAARRIYVSPRRWQREGILRQTARNWALLTLEGLGVPVDWLAVHYPAVR